MNRDNNRLMLELERLRRTINRDTINPQVGDLTLAKLTPIVTMVAQARAAYIKSAFELAAAGEGTPDPQKIEELREKRTTFTELVDAVNALETAIARGYVDVN